MDQTDSKVETKSVKIACEAAANVNVAYYQNAVPIIRDLAVLNETENDLSDVSVRVTSEPPFLNPGTQRIERIAAGSTHHVTTVKLELNSSFLSAVTAAQRGRISVEVWTAEQRVSEKSFEINLLPPSFWGGVNSAPELLAAFARPTDPSVDVILREASGKLAAAGRHDGMDGYRIPTKARAWEIAEAIWAALVSRSIAYVLPPRSFERTGQQIRGPSDILARQVGTCLDLTLLYAACLEQAGLHPLIILTEGHSFAGVWLRKEDFSSIVIDDPQVLRKRVQLQELALVETTLMTGSRPALFRQAVDAAAKLVAEDATSSFELAIDVSRARSAKIRPLDFGGSTEPSIAPKGTVHVAQEVGEAPVFDEELDRPQDHQTDRPLDRLETWKRSLLDLSLRNRLLNFKDTKATVTIECADPASLEDALAGGKRFNLLGRTTVSDGSDGRDSALMAAQRNEETRKDFLLDAMGRGDLHTSTSVEDIEGRLTELFRAARLAFEEGGANVLYLCLGFLKWMPQDGAGPYRAPLILLPVQLERKSVRSGFKLALHEDEVRLNPTLLQMLKQDFALALPDLSGDLPQDVSGVDIKEVWKSVRRHVKHIKGWEVTEQVVLATLSFTKYLMWKDLVDREEKLKQNRVVRHLIETPTHTYGGGSSCFVDASRYGSRRGSERSIYAVIGRFLPARGGRRRTARCRLRSLRPARHRKKPDNRQRDHQLPRARQDGPVRVSEDGGARGRPSADAGHRTW